MDFSRCSHSQDTAECTTLTAGINSFSSCPLVERMWKSANESFQTVRAELAGGSLTVVLHIKGKPPAAGVCCWKNRPKDCGCGVWVGHLHLLTFKTYIPSKGLTGITLFYINMRQDFGSTPVGAGQDEEGLPTGWSLPLAVDKSTMSMQHSFTLWQESFLMGCPQSHEERH